MKRGIKIALRVLAALVGAALLALLIVAAAFGIKGYRLYRDAVEREPIAEKVEAIRAMDGFTRYDELPQLYIDAVICVEDHRFFSHPGIDVIAIGRAIWNDLRSMSFAEGGSTITQQLMKNLYFTQEKKLERKFAEVFAAFELEAIYSKEEIFELYVNTIYFGSGYYGIHDAAQGYFGKTPDALDEAECVMLAGLPNAPTAYSLDANPTLALQRMRQVLRRMVECEAMTQTQADALLDQAAVQVARREPEPAAALPPAGGEAARSVRPDGLAASQKRGEKVSFPRAFFAFSLTPGGIVI